MSLSDRAKNYGHRAALILLIGPDVTGKSFLAKKLESMLVAEGRHAYLLDPENLRRGLDADLQEGEGKESVRRYGEVARLLIDTGLLVISTTNAFNLPSDQTVPCDLRIASTKSSALRRASASPVRKAARISPSCQSPIISASHQE